MKKERKGEWVEVCGVNVPKHQLEEARKELDGLMDDQETQYRRMQQEIQDPEKDFDVHTLLHWAPIFRDNGKPELATLALKKVENIFERALQGECSLSEMTYIAMVYAQDLDMQEKTLDIMDEIGALSDNFENVIAMAELSAEAIGDRMASVEYYRQAEGMIKDLKQRCILAQSVIKYNDKAWGEDIYFWHVEKELEIPCFETLFPIIDILEDMNPDLADQGKTQLLELAKFDKNKLMQFLHTPWAHCYELEIKKMLENMGRVKDSAVQ